MAHHTRPFIGINADFVAAGKVTTAHARLNAGYFDTVVAAGGLPVILPPLGREQEIGQLLDRLMREPGKQNVVKRARLSGNSIHDARVGMSMQVHPPR